MNFQNIRLKEIHGIIKYTPKTNKWRADCRKDHIIGIQLSGAAHHDLGYKEFVLSRNYIYFFNQKVRYDVQVIERGEAFSIHFTTFGEIDIESFCIPVSNGDEIFAILQKAERKKGIGAEGELIVISLFYKLLSEFARIHEKTYSPKDKRMVLVREYIDKSFKEKDCLKVAREESGLTARRFCELFKSNFDVTPNRYIITKKIEYAETLLSTGRFTVTEIAQASGFSDVYYFSKMFKEVRGVPPTKWV